MKAIVVDNNQEGNPLSWQEVTQPIYAADEVLVNIHATALNRADLMQRAGNYPPPPGAPNIMGLEMAGTIAAVGGQAKQAGYTEGERVCALLPGGGYAEQVAVPYRMLMRINEMEPDSTSGAGWSFEEAAAIPEVFFTAYLNLFMEAGLKAGDTVLMHGGASGVGTAGIQMAREAGCCVIITAGTQEKIDYCRELGADLAINYKEDDFVERIQAFTGGEGGSEGVDVIMDMVGGSYLKKNLRLLKPYGRLVIISMLGGATAEINLGWLMRPRLRLIGSVLRPRSVDEKVELKRRFLEQFGAHLRDGRIKPIIDSVYPIEETEAAQAHMAANKNIGKIILKVKG